MKEGLMHDCANWGTENCHDEVAKWKFAKTVDEGESIPIWPAVLGKEQNKLDDICKTCLHFKTQPE